MRERPILFSGAMVRAILDGRKTETRRVVRPRSAHAQELMRIATARLGAPGDGSVLRGQLDGMCRWYSPYGQAGDVLWVRETWRPRTHENGHRVPPGRFVYRADQAPPGDGGPWRPSIFMPRDACRLRLRVLEVRVEKLWSIDEAGALAEGAPRPKGHGSYLASFRALWDSTNGKRAPWASCPWVWVLRFEVLT